MSPPLKIDRCCALPYFLYHTMSKPCEGITLAPIKGSHLAGAQQQPVVQKGSYVPPNKRVAAAVAEGPKVLTKEEMSSVENFPSLGGGASWTQIRDRLAPSKPNFKGMIEERIKREKQELENREEKEDEDGWLTLRLGADYGFGPRTSKPPAIDPADFPPDKTEWPPMGIPPGFGEKTWNFVECVHAEGTPIERTKLPEKTYYDYEMRKKTAREKLLSFVKGK